MNQEHQYFLISSIVAFLAILDIIFSLNSNTYKMGTAFEQKPTLKNTGYGSSKLVISNTLELLSSRVSSSQEVDLIPCVCNEVIDNNEWSKDIFMIALENFKTRGKAPGMGSIKLTYNIISIPGLKLG